MAILNSVKNAISTAAKAISSKYGGGGSSSSNKPSSSKPSSGSSSNKSVSGSNLSSGGGGGSGSSKKPSGSSGSGSSSSSTKGSASDGSYVVAGDKKSVAENQAFGYKEAVAASKRGEYSGVPTLGKSTTTSNSTLQSESSDQLTPVVAYNKLLTGGTPTHLEYSQAAGITNPDILKSNNPKLQGKIKTIALTAPSYAHFVPENSYRKPDGTLTTVAQGAKVDTSGWEKLTPNTKRQDNVSHFDRYAAAMSSSPETANRLLKGGGDSRPVNIYNAKDEIVGTVMTDSDRGTTLTAMFEKPTPKQTPLWERARNAVFGTPNIATRPIGPTESASVREGLLRDSNNNYNAGHYYTDTVINNMNDVGRMLAYAPNTALESYRESRENVAVTGEKYADPLIKSVIEPWSGLYVDSEKKVRKADGSAFSSLKLGNKTYGVNLWNIPRVMAGDGSRIDNIVYEDKGDPTGDLNVRYQDRPEYQTKEFDFFKDMPISEMPGYAYDFLKETEPVGTIVLLNSWNKFAENPTRTTISKAEELGKAYLGGRILGTGAKYGAKYLAKKG
ncbi:MAG: hypothetical protein Q4B70_10170, partial [Lachnospiraceae bacterium]|nr:hypothetical protein [Lachnospiraceae bacterium]